MRSPDPGRSTSLKELDMPVSQAPILVVDDDAKIVKLVRTYLEREGYRVVEASDGRSALAAVALETPSLLVLDMMLPEVDGLAIIRAVRRTQQTPIVVISARGTTADRIAGLSEGADDYLPKPFSPAELVVRVKRVLARTETTTLDRDDPGGTEGASRLPDALVLRHGDLEMDLDRHETSVAGRRVELTAMEFRLLAALLQARGRVLTRDRLLDALYGEDEAAVLDRSVDALVKRLREKLGDDAERPRYVATVRGVGYRSAPLDSGAPDGTPDQAAADGRTTRPLGAAR
jgi:DNA-binding response OmpR family regulator